jgi:phage tail-like protein
MDAQQPPGSGTDAQPPGNGTDTQQPPGNGTDAQQPQSSYLGYLPAIFRQEPFLGSFLLAFETVLSGTDGNPGLEFAIGHVADYLDPWATGADFLPWLAGWVSLSLRADWDEKTQRSFIQEIVPLYRLRGTLNGLSRMLQLYTGQPVVIYDDFEDLPFFFEVQLTLSEADPALLQVKQQIARAIIDQEKPAHTFYALQIAVPTMRLVSEARHERENAPLLILGTNTLLGTSIPSL